MNSFQGKIGWKSMRKIENSKKKKKDSKNSKIPLWIHFQPYQVGKG